MRAVDNHTSIYNRYFGHDQVTTIEPQKGWRLLDLRELWAYRELLYVLTVRDIGASALAERTGVNRSTIHRILTDETMWPDAGLLRQLKSVAMLSTRRRIREEQGRYAAP